VQHLPPALESALRKRREGAEPTLQIPVMTCHATRAIFLFAIICAASGILPAAPKPTQTHEPQQRVVPTNIIICIDTSGSMEDAIANAIKNFNTEILDTQKKLFSNAVDINGEVPPEDLALITLIRFSGRDDIRVVFQDVRIQDAKHLDPSEWVAEGMTALRDTIIFADRLNRRNDRKTLMFYITDGDDTDSSRESLDKVRRIFKRYEESQANAANATIAYFIGSNQDAVQNGAGMGLAQARSMSFSDASVEYMMDSISDVIEMSVRDSAAVPDFSDGMRRRAMNGESEDGLAGAKLDEL
jgi:uncharacterized protein YegL